MQLTRKVLVEKKFELWRYTTPDDILVLKISNKLNYFAFNV